MTYRKPCEREGCLALTTADTPSQHAARRFCSVKCAAIVRCAAGARGPVMSDAMRRRVGRKGGLRAAEVRKQKAAHRVAGELERLIPAEMEMRTDARDLARFKALLSRAWFAGHTVGCYTERRRIRFGRAS